MGARIARIAGTAGIIVALAAPAAHADIPAGSFDPSWDNDGLSVTSVEQGVSRGYAAVLQSDNKAVVAGWSRNFANEEHFAVVRYTPSGALDPAWDGDGRQETPIPGATDAKAFAMIQQADGKIVVAGKAVDAPVAPGNPPTDVQWAVVRYNTNGSLDNSFGGGDGIVRFQMGDDADCALAGYWGAAAYGVTLQGSKIVVTGCARQGARDYFALARLNSDGSLDDDSGSDLDQNDTPFGTGGKTLHDVALVDNKGAYPMGIVRTAGGFAVGGWVEAASDVPVLTRYTDDGAPAGGPTSVPFGQGARIVAIAQQADGRIVAAGTSALSFFAVRFTAGGALDPTFNGGNPNSTAISPGTSSWGGGVALQPDGKVVVGGHVSNGTNNGLGLVRYTASGNEDDTFGNGGAAFLPNGANQQRNGVDQTGVLVQPDGRIIIAHAGGQGDQGGGHFAAARVFGETILTDVDGDGVLDRNDNCVNDPNPSQGDQDGDGAGNACDADDENDGVADGSDNCNVTFNPDQGDLDRDGAGDACDGDDDNDGVGDERDNCGRTVNSDQRDSDRDGLGAACDENDGDALPFSVSVNGGNPFTRNPIVKLTIVVPDGTTAVAISNDGGFARAETRPVSADRTYNWALDTSRRDVTKVVYVRPIGPGVANRTATDDIVLDTARPAVDLAKRSRNGTRLLIRARDPKPGTGVAQMQVTTNRKKPGRLLKFSRSRKINRGSNKRLFVRVRDKAGNFSQWRPERRGNR